VIVPGLWLLFTRRELSSRKGIALVLTPAELLVRTRAGVQRVRWSDVARLEITSRRAWSILIGPHEARSLIVHHKDDGRIRFREMQVAAPLEVVASLCEAYKKGLLP
jgi:hypothetical protein